MTTVTVRRPARLEGEIRVPGDKSVSHRALLLNALATGEAKVSGLSRGADVASTAACLRRLGVEIEGERVRGAGLRGLSAATAPLDCGNSGTTMRLLAGILAAQPFESVLVGDESLSRRPMGRVAEPLRLMGANCETGPPLRVGAAGTELHGIEYAMAVPSAQVKSAILLAALYARGHTTVISGSGTRDHTELMLAAMGAPVQAGQGRVSVGQVDGLRPLDVEVPGDISAAAFWLAAAALHGAAHLRIPGVGLNPTRSAIVDVLRAAGLNVAAENRRTLGAEAAGDLEAGSSSGERRSLEISGALTAQNIDELPILAVVGTQLPGLTVIRDAAELRVKESDRIAAMAEGLARLGADVRERPDGLEIRGGKPLEGARVSSHGDHRVAMSLAVAGMLAGGRTEIEGAECVDISYPGFWEEAERLGAIA